MRYTLTFKENDYAELTEYLFVDRSVERAAYALCKMSISDSETRLLVREIIKIAPEDIEKATPINIRIKSRSFIAAMQQADRTKHVFIFIHSHPDGYVAHSKQDDIEEEKLFSTAYNRIKTKGVHGSLVLSDPDKPVGRIWLEDKSIKPVSLIRVIGKKFFFYTDLTKVDPLPIFFDRQIRAFGEDIQKVLLILKIGVVGAGGTGSSIIEQLCRLGIGHLTIFDYDPFEKSNVNRVYGSNVGDNKKLKIDIAERNIQNIGLKTGITKINKSITYPSAAQKLKDCDIVFGCTDDNWGRSILNRLAVYYQIPVFDMGVKISADDGLIDHIEGRVTTLLGSNACLLCRNRITAKAIEAENLSELDPNRYQALKEEGYVDDLATTAPAVIPFTTNIASLAITEMLHRLTGFMGDYRESNEIIVQFHDSKLRRNSRISDSGCFCGESSIIMLGDRNLFLDTTWRTEA